MNKDYSQKIDKSRCAESSLACEGVAAVIRAQPWEPANDHSPHNQRISPVTVGGFVSGQ